MISSTSHPAFPRRSNHPRRLKVTPIPSDPPFESLLQANAAIAAQIGLIESIHTEISLLEEGRNVARKQSDTLIENEAREHLSRILPHYLLDGIQTMRWGDSVSLDLGTPWIVNLKLWENNERKSPRFSVKFTGWAGMGMDMIDDFHDFATAVRSQLPELQELAGLFRKDQIGYEAAENRFNDLREQLRHKELSAYCQLAALETVRLLHGLRLEPRIGDTLTFRLEARREEEFEWLQVTGVNHDHTVAEVTGRYREALSKGQGYRRISTGKKITVTRYARVETLGRAFLNLIDRGGMKYRFRDLE